MISDEERREIAGKLRSLDERIEGMPLMCTKQEHNAMALRAIRAVVGKGDIFHLLADLIDRSTCGNVSGYQDVFVCSECRCKVEAVGEECNEYGEVFSTPLMPRFCPNCGAEVVE